MIVEAFVHAGNKMEGFWFAFESFAASACILPYFVGAISIS